MALVSLSWALANRRGYPGQPGNVPLQFLVGCPRMLLERGINVNVMFDIKFSRRSGMVLSWFDASEAKAFGTSLAYFYIERVPPGGSGGKNKSIAKKQEVINKMFQRMARFKLDHKLNIYKKAQMGNAFKWALKDAGYDPVFVDQLTKDLMLKF